MIHVSRYGRGQHNIIYQGVKQNILLGHWNGYAGDACYTNEKSTDGKGWIRSLAGGDKLTVNVGNKWHIHVQQGEKLFEV